MIVNATQKVAVGINISLIKGKYKYETIHSKYVSFLIYIQNTYMYILKN